jgi:phosphohistidine swiveling domain-containing protein
MPRLLSLDDAGARDPAVVGSKASNLARARSAGMPVFPGWVLPAGESAEAMRAGAQAFARSGSASACLAVSDIDVAGELRQAFSAIAASTGGTFVVRSSTSFDDDPRWAGAFATYLDVTPQDLPSAVRGCWASAFTRDVTRRGERLGLMPWDRGVAVLLQPYAAFDVGGTAVLSADDRTRVTVARGGPAGIVGGGGTGTIVEIAEEASEGDIAGPVPGGPKVLVAVAALVRSVHEESGNDAIEWGAAGGALTLLQTGRAPERPARPTARRPAPVKRSEAARRLAAAADRCPAPLGEMWVLPWAASMSALPPTPVLTIHDVPAALNEARALALHLTGRAWGASGPVAAAEAAATFRIALGPRPEDAWERLDGLRPVDPAAAARVLGLVGAVGRRLAKEGLLPHPDAVWRQSPAELDRATSPGDDAPSRSGPDRWEPFVFEVVEHAGDARLGTPAAPGIGAGRPVAIRGPGDLSQIEPRRVLALSRPIPHVAPLVWGCAAIVSAGGSPGAHLFEVARSLGVPAVVGVDVMDAATDSLLAVDGNHGRVTSWTPSLDAGARRTGT